MKVVILAGGRGTRLSEETQLIPKPLVQVDSHPIIFHIMQNYSRFGYTDFIILTGYKGNELKKYFDDFWAEAERVSFNLQTNEKTIIKRNAFPWNVTIMDTGLDTQTAGRILQAKDLVGDSFLLTYGDGVSDVDINLLVEQHNKSDFDVTLTAVRPAARFGALEISGNKITKFVEKPSGDESWINGGFFVVNSKVLSEIKSLDSIWENDILPKLASSNRLGVMKHQGLWHAVDTVRDLWRLRESMENKEYPWV